MTEAMYDELTGEAEHDAFTYTTPSEWHSAWHRENDVPMGQPGCPHDACDGDDWDYGPQRRNPMPAITDADVAADQVLPLDGPYDPEVVQAAARTISELVRRLNHATFDGGVFQYPAQLSNTVGAIRDAVVRLDQLFTQLDHQLGGFAEDPALYASYGRDVTTEVPLARNAFAGARAASSDLATVMTMAWTSLNRLGLNDD